MASFILAVPAVPIRLKVTLSFVWVASVFYQLLLGGKLASKALKAKRVPKYSNQIPKLTNGNQLKAKWDSSNS